MGLDWILDGTGLMETGLDWIGWDLTGWDGMGIIG